MPKYIDINDFEGALTNADIEDLPDNVAQEIKNLKIQGGKLEKTFGAGSPADLPTFELALVNSELSKTYAVYNIFTFVSDKFTGNSNDAGDGYRYLLVTVEATAQTVILWWYDPSMPDVTDTLQVENDVIWFETASAHGFEVGDMVMVQDGKDNASPQASQSAWKTYESVDMVPSTKKLGVNTNSADSWGGSFFATTNVTGSATYSFGGKHQTHLLVDNEVDYGGTNFASIEKIAIAPTGGKVLSIAQGNNGSSTGKDLAYCISSAYLDLGSSLYTTYRGKTNFKVMSMLGFNDAIYIHYSYQDGSPVAYYNKLVKYTLSGSTVVETAIGDLGSQNNSIVNYASYMTVANNHLFVLGKSLGLFKVNTSGTITSMTVSGIAMVNVKGITSIAQTNNLNADGSSSGSDVAHVYLVIGTTDGSANTNLYTLDIASSETSFTAFGTTLTDTTINHLKKMDFGENNNKSESIVIQYTGLSNRQYLRYSSHDNSTAIISDIDTDISSSVFSIATDVHFIENTANHPGSTSYLMVGTDDDSDSATAGTLYGVNNSKGVKTFMSGASGGKTNWNPTCFADCVTGSGFFSYAKGYIGVYGTEAQDGSPVGDHADVYRFTDIGWYSNSFGGSGDCDYRWIDVTNRYDIPTLYHKKDRNPIVPFGDTLRVLPGNIAKVGSNESKGAWIGYIDRSLMNDGVTQTGWFAYANTLTNPFSFNSDTEILKTSDELRDTDNIKYNLTAIYDGVQETVLEEDKTLLFESTSTDSTTEISKSRLSFNIDADFTTLNKRITGLNIYRSGRYNGVWETYKKVSEVNFLRADDTFTDSKRVLLQSDNDDYVYVQDQDNYISGLGTATLGNGDYAIKVGNNWKRRIKSDGVTAIQGYAPTGVYLNEEITSGANSVLVSASSGLSDSTSYYLDGEIVTVSSAHVNTTLSITRAQGSPTTTASSHAKYTEFRATSLTDTGWYRIDLDGDNLRGKRFADNWKIYIDTIGGSLASHWVRTKNATNNGAYGGRYVGWVSPEPYEETGGNLSILGWRNTSNGSIDVSSVSGKHIAIEESGEAQMYKVDQISAYDSHSQRAYVQINKGFPKGAYSHKGEITAPTTYTDNGSSSYTVKVTDEGLTNLGEHWGESVFSTKTHAQYAKILKGRLFYANLMLDVGDKNEAQNDWVGYSELSAFDVRPVSNVLPFPDREGGQITGLSDLFGRLIIFKPQAIFVLDVVDPANPTTWVRKESKYNIGNIAPEGIVEVHDSVYFVHHDGIYRLDANTVASSTLTPSVMEKITLPIEDQFLLADSKKAVKGIYDQKNNELLFTWDQSNAQKVWAYHVILKSWRKVDTTTNLDILTFGENSGPLAWDNTDTDIKKFDVAENVGITWKSKRFRMDLDRKQLLRYGMVKFTGTDTVTFNIYLDGSGSVSFTKDITADGGVNRFPIKRYGKSFEMELTTPSSSNTFFLERLRIELE